MKSTLVRPSALVALLACTACAACSASAEDGATSASELRASTPRFSLEEPVASPRLEALRRELESSESGYEWVANESDTFAVRVEPWDARSDDLGDLVQKAFVFRRQLADPSAPSAPLLRGLRKVPPLAEGLAAALDALGRTVDGPDVATQSERAVLESRLRDAAAGEGVVVFRASLREPDMYWEGAMVVVDPAHGEILFATGGYGT